VTYGAGGRPLIDGEEAGGGSGVEEKVDGSLRSGTTRIYRRTT
jgi:hypothetical protein